MGTCCLGDGETKAIDITNAPLVGTDQTHSEKDAEVVEVKQIESGQVSEKAQDDCS